MDAEIVRSLAIVLSAVMFFFMGYFLGRLIASQQEHKKKRNEIFDRIDKRYERLSRIGKEGDGA